MLGRRNREPGRRRRHEALLLLLWLLLQLLCVGILRIGVDRGGGASRRVVPPNKRWGRGSFYLVSWHLLIWAEADEREGKRMVTGRKTFGVKGGKGRVTAWPDKGWQGPQATSECNICLVKANGMYVRTWQDT